MPKEFGAWAWIRSTGDTLSASVVSEAAAILNPASSRNEPWSALDGLGTKILQMEELPGPDALVHACASNGPAMPINPEDRLKAPKPAEAQWSWLRKRAAFAGGRRISSMANVGGVACGLVFLGLVLAYHEMRMSIPAAAAPTGQALPIEKSEQPTNDSTLPGERANPEFKPE